MCIRACVVTVTLFTASSVLAAKTDLVLPDEVSAHDWTQIQQQIQAHRFYAEANEASSGGWQARNPSHGFSINYQPDGQTVLTLPNHGSSAHTIALRLQGYGYDDDLIPVNSSPTLSANGNTVAYQWKPGLREWWINNEQGVAQWFELAERPEFTNQAANNDQPLTLAMHLETSFNAEVRNNKLALTSRDGTQITYDRLKVWDANGRILPSRMQLNGDQLALQIDDAEAIYPVTIDPTFSQTAFVKASIAEAGDNFGDSIALEGDTLVVGAPTEDSSSTGGQGDNSVMTAGAVYVFERDAGGVWNQTAFLKASNAEADDRFGRAVALSGDTLIVSALNEDSSATGGQSDNSAEDAGAVYVFVRSGTSWAQQAYLKASNAEQDDRFGWSVALDGDTAVIGTIDERSNGSGGQNDNSEDDAGAAYVFVRTGTNWVQQGYLKASNAEEDDFFGDSVAVSGDTVVVGARLEDSSISGGEGDNSASNSGAAYVFERNGSGVWSQQALLKASNAESGDQFGVSAALSGNTLVVGAIGESSSATGGEGDNSVSQSGAAYIFERNGGGTWSQQPYLKASNAGFADFFGVAVAISGDTVVVGARLEDSSATGGEGDNSADDAGAAFVFVRSGSSWSQQAYRKASNAETGDWFGESVAVSGDTIAVGAPRENSSNSGGEGDNSENSAGAVYVFGEPVFSIGGTVSGLAGTGLQLQNNGGDDLTIASNGAFTFATALLDGSNYAVTVSAQPTVPSQTCTVINGTGAVWGLDVTNVEVSCEIDQFTVGGTVSGLAGTGLILQNNAGDDLPISSNGSFNFSAQDDGSAYAVTVQTSPSGPSQTCTVTNANGTISGADVTDVAVECVTNQFTVGGTVSGLTGTGLVLQNNGGDNLAIAADGPFVFSTALDDGSGYAVTVLTQPSSARDQQCTVSNGTGTLAGSDVTDVAVSCIDITLGLSTTDLDLGLVFLGADGTGTITVSNTGTAELMLSDISAPTAPFSLTGGSCQPLPTTLAAGESCTIEIGFSPTTIGEFTEEIEIISNAVSSPDAITINGRGSIEPMVVPVMNHFGLLLLTLLSLMIGLAAVRRMS